MNFFEYTIWKIIGERFVVKCNSWTDKHFNSFIQNREASPFELKYLREYEKVRVYVGDFWLGHYQICIANTAY